MTILDVLLNPYRVVKTIYWIIIIIILFCCNKRGPKPDGKKLIPERKILKNSYSTVMFVRTTNLH